MPAVSRGFRRIGLPLTVALLVAASLTPVVLSESAGAVTVPTEPRNVVAVGGRTTGNMTVTWIAPANANGSTIIRYLIATSTDGGPFAAPVDVGKIKKQLMPCAGVTSCDFRVYATNSAGTSGPSTIAHGVWAVPGAPILRAVDGGPAVGKMALTLSAPVTNGGKDVTGYLYDMQVNSAGAWFGPYALTGTSPRVADCTSVNPAGGCKYRVYAVNSIGTSPASNTVVGLWEVPTVSQITTLTPGRPAASATVAWNAPQDTGGLAVSYSYEVSADGGAWVAGASSLPSSPRKAIVECPGTNNCSYRITSHNAKGAGPVGNATSTAFNPPGGVTGLVASVATVGDLNLGSGDPTVTALWSAPANLGGSPITGYQGRVCIGNCDETDSAWASASIVSLGMTTSWSTPCPANQVTCSYQVRGVNAVGVGAWGKSVRMSPFAVTNVTAVTAAPAGSVAVGWSGPAEVGSGIDHYTLYRCITTTGCSNNANWADTGLVIPGNTFTATHNCGQGVSCTYKVAAAETGSGASSSSSAASVASGSTLPDAPSALTAATNSSTIGAVDLSWTAPANSGSFPVLHYVFERSINSGAYSAPISTGSAATTYTDTGCGANNACTYRVSAVTGAGTGSASNTATAEGANVPSAPQNLTATPGVSLGGVDLAWQVPVDNGGRPVTGYYLERSFNGGTTWPDTFTLGTSLSYADSTCGQGVSCTYRVSAINSLGTGAASNTATATGTNLGAPQSLTATTSTPDGVSNLGGVDLSWSPPATSTFPIASYEFRYQSDTGSGFGAFTAWASTGTGTGTSFTHICAVGNVNTTCRYEVRAIDTQSSTSVPSNQATAAGLTDHVAPTVTITTPANNSAAQTTTPTISGTAGNGVGDSTTVNVTIKQGASTIRTFAVTRSGTAWLVGSTEWAAGSPTSLADGTYTVVANQTDWASNTGTSNIRTFTVDNNAPSVTITAPGSGDLFNSSGTTFVTGSLLTWGGSITGTASDGGSGVANVKVSIRRDSTGLYWNGTSFASASENLITATGTTSWSLAFPIANFPAGGAYTIRAVGTDNATNASAGTSVTANVDENPNNTVYVATTGNDANSGLTPTLPKATIGAGLIAAQSNSRSFVAVAGGSYGALSISGASYGNSKLVAGGFNSSTWLRAAPGTNTVTISAAGTAVVIDAKTGNTLQQLTISATNAGLAAGDSVYGVRLINAATGTNLERVVVTAANGVAGTAGSNGSGNAGTASNGGGGGGACGNCSTRGAAGSSGAGVGGRNGGGGGQGAPDSNTTGNAGSNGIVSAGGGGNGGAGGGSNGSCNDAFGGAGGSRSTATTGGSAGGAGAAGGITLTSGGNTWAGGTAGGSGSAGGNGHGGGGGGGGGGDSGSFISCSADAGAGGGGGGGGGGAGTGVGTGGGPGGGSFALYVVTNSGAIVTNSTLTSGNGGAGGTGGTGAAGTAGGSGGNGGNCDTGQEAGSGGGGGGGSGGGGAGGGGGGAAGPSIVVYEVGTGSVTLAGTNSLTKGTSTGGSGGSGGSGGGGGGAGTRGNSARVEGNNGNGCYAGFDGAAGTNGSTGSTGGTGGTSALTTYIDTVSTP